MLNSQPFTRTWVNLYFVRGMVTTDISKIGTDGWTISNKQTEKTVSPIVMLNMSMALLRAGYTLYSEYNDNDTVISRIFVRDVRADGTIV